LAEKNDLSNWKLTAVAVFFEWEKEDEVPNKTQPSAPEVERKKVRGGGQPILRKGIVVRGKGRVRKGYDGRPGACGG